MSNLNLLDSGVFTVPMIAELISVPRSKVRAWVNGHGKTQKPLIDNELSQVDDKLAVSFTNLMELQFVNFFTKAGVKLRDIRAIMQEAKRALNHPHPFATKTVFQTDKKKIVAKIAKDNGVEHIYDLKSQNYEMKDIVMQSFEHDMIYDPNGNACVWYPRRNRCPNVVINPRRSFGRPILQGSQIPTEAIFKVFLVEESLETVSAMFEIGEQDVREAVDFENTLREAA